MYAQVKKTFFDQYVHQVISLISAFSVLRKFGKFLIFLLIVWIIFLKKFQNFLPKKIENPSSNQKIF
jgi:hypothetical protein